MSILEQTIDYIKQFGQDIIEEVTLIPDSALNQYRNIKYAFRIQMEILDGPATLVVGLPFDFPSSLPHFYDSQRQFSFIPHLEDDGFVCFTRNENLVIDERYPGRVVLDCLEKVITVLESGETESENHNFLEEFEVYWAKTCNFRKAHIIVNENNDVVRELDLYLMPMDDVTYFICEKNYNPEHYMQTVFHQNSGALTKRRCIYIPLEYGTFITPPRRGQFWNFKKLRDFILKNINSEKRNILLKLFSKTPKSNSQYDYFCLGLPIDNEKKALIGITINYPDGMVVNHKAKITLHPFVQSPAKIELIPFSISRHQKDFLLARTGGDSGFTKKNAVVVGVGAIGSVVATGLAKAGFHTITLIDHDLLDVENIYRHELGVDQIFDGNESKNLIPQRKVEALKKEIQRKYPFTQVETIPQKINTVIAENQVDWNAVDFVIVCIGAPNVEMFINRYMHKLENAPPVIYSWVEPFGIGGHVLITLNKEKKGCYQCLFRPLSDEEPIRNLSSFVKPGQSFTKSLGGCGTYFTPYSFLDSEETANKVLRAVYQVSRGQIYANPILSWKGNPAPFLEQGFQVSSRYEMSEEKLSVNSLLYHDPNCPVCSKKESRYNVESHFSFT
ncbi:MULTISPECIES: ThiF family adenylyltransferase [unclassified Paenibacillus]|uniref:ThiF family adenylyltransferase n=1 Tax=unclassified Paenibacillus TaxID=185978 RepID=UPI000491A5B4|nr:MULTISPECIES: ThiF family adenylyltransferase [unclassified Paenibacillus]SFR27608.1 Molybdopterin or thiamine biosynthesis adenylyltransferase [Paenibacillus sp. cl130]